MVWVENGHVVSIDLTSNGLDGIIPTEIGNLTNLRSLDLSMNQLSGTIPSVIGNLYNLQNLWLYQNNLSGSIPENIDGLGNLVSLYLHDNQLTGELPFNIGNLTLLTELIVENNNLSGAIPAGIVDITGLQTLYITGNQFTDLPDISSLNLTTFSLQNNLFQFDDLEPNKDILPAFINQANFAVSPSIYTFNEGQTRALYVNVGGSANQYQWFKDSNPVSGLSSSSIYTFNATAETAGVYTCQVTNSIVPNLTLSSEFITVIVNTLPVDDIDPNDKAALMALYNSTNGPNWTNNSGWNTAAPVRDWYGVTVEGGRVTQIYLQNNNLVGTIPAEIGNLSSLRWLDFYQNEQLSGSIPPQIGNLSSLQRLDLSLTQLSGSIPAEIGNLNSLQELHISAYQLSGSLSGSIPPEIGNLSSLQILGISNIQLSGSIPP